MEVLLINIREDHNIDGIQIDQNNCIKLSCYTDDLTCFVKDANSAHRDLTVIVKILIVKVLGLSKFNYVSSMISTPVAIQKRINTLVHQFIWNGPDRVKRSEMSANCDEGGLKMIDISTKIKAQQLIWLKRFFSGNQVGWKLILII